MIIRAIKDREYPIYESVAEFRQDYPNDVLIHDWRLGSEGAWIETDDGQVCEIIKRSSIHKGKAHNTTTDFIRTPIGSFVCLDSVVFEGKPRRNIYSFGDAANYTQDELVLKRKKLTSKEFVFGKLIMKGKDIADAYMSAFPTNNSGYAEKRGQLLLKTERIKKLMRQEVEDALGSAGITLDRVLEITSQLLEDGSEKTKFQIIKELFDVFQLKDSDKQKQQFTVFQGFTNDQIDAISKGDSKKIASAAKDIERD